MTVKELKEILTLFPDSMTVQISCDKYVREIVEASTIVDIDTNVVSVNIVAKDKPSLAEMLDEL